jgi:hypothetical protein
VNFPVNRIAAGLALAGVAILFVRQEGQPRSDAEKRESHVQFMARKLEYTKELLAGLSGRDLQVVAERADKLGLLCLDLSWNVIQTDEYFERSTTFRRTAGTIATAAREEKHERAQLAFLDLVGQCFSCHDYVRDHRKK